MVISHLRKCSKVQITGRFINTSHLQCCYNVRGFFSYRNMYILQCATMHMDRYLMLWGKSFAHRFFLIEDGELIFSLWVRVLEVMSLPIYKTLSETLTRKTEFCFYFAFSLFLKDSECGAQAELSPRQAQLCFAVLQVTRGIHPAFFSGWSSQECPTLQWARRAI